MILYILTICHGVCKNGLLNLLDLLNLWTFEPLDF